MARAGFGSFLQKVFSSSNKGLLNDLLTGAGLTLASNAVFLTLANQYISTIQAQTAGLSQGLAVMLHLSGIDYSISIVLSAIITRLTLKPPSLSFMRK